MLQPKILATMLEATRLTRAGKLTQAVAVLQGRSKSSNEIKPEQVGWVRSVEEATPPGDHVSEKPVGIAQQADPLAVLRPSTSIRETLRAFATGHLKAGRLARAFGTANAVPLPPGARFDEHLHSNASGSRSYKLYVPASYRGEARPLIIMLHGCTQSPDDFAAGTRMNELAEEQGCLVAYPRQPASANASHCWNWFNAGEQMRDRGEAGLIAGIVRQITNELSVDATCIYVAGLSAGGAAAASMGAVYPDLFAAIGVHSGLAHGAAMSMPAAFTAMRQGSPGLRQAKSTSIPAIVFHGDRDTTVSPVNGDYVIAQARAGGQFLSVATTGRSASGMSYTRTVNTDEAGQALLEQWVLHGAGHAWSGGSAAGSYTDPSGPDASREMLRFFLSHRRQE